MKAKAFLGTLICGLSLLPLSYAQERYYGATIPPEMEKNYAVGVAATAQQVVIQGDRAKFNEYRDIRDGVYGRVEAAVDTNQYYLDFTASDMGYKSQHYEASGGKWGAFRAFLSYDQLPHNFTFGARSFYSGIGSNNLSYPIHPPTTNVATWNSFDYSVERRNYAGGLKVEALKPFFFNVSATTETRKGIYPFGVAGTTTQGIALELPTAIDYITDTLRVETGYAQNPLSLNLGFSLSQFNNDKGQLNFRNPATNNTAAAFADTLTLPPDNTFYKFDFKGTLRLPLKSKVNVDLGWSRSEAKTSLLTNYVADVAAADSNIGVRGLNGITVNDLLFEGRLDTWNAGFVLTSNPISFLDGKVFYKKFDSNNQSDRITTVDPDPPLAGQLQSIFSNDLRLFDYSKENYGAEIGLRLPLSFHLTGAYTRVIVKREREDIPENRDHIFAGELRWSGVDFLVAKVGYERLERKADFEVPAGAAAIEAFVRRYDGASKDQDTYKAAVDIFPMEDLTLSAGFRYKDADYKDTIIGLRKLRSQEFNVDADYLILKRVRLFAYFDYELMKLDQFQRQFTADANANPFLAPTATAFNWTITEKDNNLGYGFGTEIYVIPKKLTFRFQYTSVKSEGFADYTYLLGGAAFPAPAGRNNDNVDIPNLDSYRLDYFLAKATYYPIKNLSLSAGFVYEKYVYDDAQLNGYQFVTNPAAPFTGTNAALLTGAYSNPGYRANIFFLSAAYKF